MGARAKAFFSVAAIALALLCFWLWRFMPTQGWAEIDFRRAPPGARGLKRVKATCLVIR